MSTVPRMFVAVPLSVGVEVAADAAQARHLGTVLRRGAGDAVRLYNGADGEWSARIVAQRRDGATLIAEALLRPQAAPPDLRLLLAALKREAMEWAVEKATELGVAAILPVLTRRAVPDRVNLDRLRLVAQAAAEQCERLTLPRIAPAQPLHVVLDGWDGAPLLVAAERRAAPPLLAAAAGLRPPLGLLVGPEGGFDRAELDAALSRPFVAPVGLGPRILRAETAAIAGLALLQAVAGDGQAAATAG